LDTVLLAHMLSQRSMVEASLSVDRHAIVVADDEIGELERSYYNLAICLDMVLYLGCFVHGKLLPSEPSKAAQTSPISKENTIILDMVGSLKN